MTRRGSRLAALVLVATSVVGGLAAYSLSTDPLVYYHTPSEVADAVIDGDKQVRLGGVVVEDSLRREGEWRRFLLTDGVAEVEVRHEGEIRGVFSEGQGALVEGHVDGKGAFVSHRVMVQHDNSYEAGSSESSGEAAGRTAP